MTPHKDAPGVSPQSSRFSLPVPSPGPLITTRPDPQMRQKKAKPSAQEHSRPFSRMHNFFILDRGDKWAKTGTSFRPKSSKFAPPGFQNASPALTAQGSPALGATPVPLFLRNNSHAQTLLASPLLRAAEGLERDAPPDTAGMELLSGACSAVLASVGTHRATFTRPSAPVEPPTSSGESAASSANTLEGVSAAGTPP